jgi:hypothetical protein
MNFWEILLMVAGGGLLLSVGALYIFFQFVVPIAGLIVGMVFQTVVIASTALGIYAGYVIGMYYLVRWIVNRIMG